MTSQEYWKKREVAQRKHNITEEKEYQKRIQKIFQNMQDEITKEINGFYVKYARKEGLTLAEAKKKVSQLDIEEYARKAAKYVKEKDFSKQANEEMRLYNATMKINRLELLKANIGLEMVSGFDELQQFFDETLTKRAMDEFQRQAGILGATIQDNAKAADALVNASFQNSTFSDRVWMYQDMLKAELANLLQTGLIRGQHPRKLATHLKKRFGVSQYNAERLMITELARVQTEAQKLSFERNDYEEYQFHALGTACGVCRALDQKHFPVKDMMPGENAPPMHPHCRCSTSAYMDREAFDKWLKEQESVEKIVKTDIMVSGARITDPDSTTGEEFAKMYYEEIRKFSTDVQRIAINLGKDEDDIGKIKAYLFEDKSLYDEDTDEYRRFAPDCAIAQSWQRLMIGKHIQPHDRTLIEHELYEMQLKEENPELEHWKAHEMACRKYDYQREAADYYGNIKKYNKNKN